MLCIDQIGSMTRKMKQAISFILSQLAMRNSNVLQWRCNMAKGKDKVKSEGKKKAQKTIKEKRKSKKEKGTKTA